MPRPTPREAPATRQTFPERSGTPAGLTGGAGQEALERGLRLGRAQGRVERLGLRRHGGLHGCVVAPDQPAGGGDRLAGLGGELGALRQRVLQESVRRHDRVGKAEPHRLVGPVGLAEEQQFGGLRHADPARQQVAGGGLRHEAEIDEGHPEGGSRRDVDEVAVIGQRRPDPDREPVHRRHHRGTGHGELADETQRRRLPEGPFGPGDEVRDVVAGGEHAPGPDEHHRADARSLAVGVLQRFPHGVVHRAGQRVLLLGAGELHEADAAGLIGDADVVGHGDSGNEARITEEGFRDGVG